MMRKKESHEFIRYTAFVILALILLAIGFGCTSKSMELPQVDAGLAETIVVTRNGWDRDILPSISAEVKEHIDKELASCEPIKSYESWSEAFPDGNVYGSPNTVTLFFPNNGEIAIQCYLIDSYIYFIDQTGANAEEHLYLVDEDWLSNFIETVTAMVEQAPDERYADKTEPQAEYEFHVMTDDNAPVGCEFEINREGQLDALEMLEQLENMKGFIFPADSELALRFSFSHEPEDVYVRYISEDHWQEQYPYENQRIRVPDDPGIYNIFVDISWESEYFETAFFSITVQDRKFETKDGASNSQPQSQPTQPVYAVTVDPAVYDISDTAITVKITNTSQAEGGYGYAYRIERNINGRWESVPLEFDVPTIAVILSAGQTSTETFSLHQEQYGYQPGEYRIVFLDGLNGAAAGFTLTGEISPTYSVAADPKSYSSNAESITVKITNTSQVEGGYGYAHRIERKTGGGWEHLELDIMWNDLLIILPAGQTKMETFSLRREQYDYKLGDYRIVFLDGLGGASAQFTLT